MIKILRFWDLSAASITRRMQDFRTLVTLLVNWPVEIKALALSDISRQINKLLGLAFTVVSNDLIQHLLQCTQNFGYFPKLSKIVVVS